jgi:hypothetical protein
MGGTLVTCKKCEHKTYLYKSCGNGQCPKCQSIKRMQWQDKMASKMMTCPYQHIVFTIPHELNFLAKAQPSIVYSNLFKAAWKTIEKLCKDPNNLGGLPGMTAVLHTFGSDLKHHIHLHTLVTFGGVSKEKKWLWPVRNKKLAPFRLMCKVFREQYLQLLSKTLKKQHPDQYQKIKPTLQSLESVRWCVHNTPPTTHTKVIEEYLGRYICRVGVSNKKLSYDSAKKEVKIVYNDYKNQQTNQAAPKAVKQVDPLVAIHLIVQHVLPPYFQKVRYFGILSGSKLKKIQVDIPSLIKENKQTIRTVFQIIKGLLLLEENDIIPCSHCQATELIILELPPNKDWYNQNIRKNYQEIKNKSPDELPAPNPMIAIHVLNANGLSMQGGEIKNQKITADS